MITGEVKDQGKNIANLHNENCITKKAIEVAYDHLGVNKPDAIDTKKLKDMAANGTIEAQKDNKTKSANVTVAQAKPAEKKKSSFV